MFYYNTKGITAHHIYIYILQVTIRGQNSSSRKTYPNTNTEIDDIVTNGELNP